MIRSYVGVVVSLCLGLALTGCPEDPAEPGITTGDAAAGTDLASDGTGGDAIVDDAGPDGTTVPDAVADGEPGEVNVGADTVVSDATTDAPPATDVVNSDADAISDGAVGDGSIADADAAPSDVPVADGGAGDGTVTPDAIADAVADAVPDAPAPGALGDPCSDASQCNSGFCFQQFGFGEGTCSECSFTEGCALGSFCSFSDTAGYGQCAGFGQLGDACSAGSDCASGFCNNQLCSQCEGDDDCGGGACLESAPGEYFQCDGGLGDDCTDAGDCNSGFCFDAPGGGNSDVCSECLIDDDCGPDEACVFDGGGIIGGGVGYAVCESTDDLGDSCNNDGDCASGFCYDPLGPGPMLCSECKEDGDCGSGFSCNFAFLQGYAECVGAVENGGACGSDAECIDGSCVGDICVGPLGSECGNGADCESGLCGANFIPISSSVCSECETAADCNGGPCNWDFLAGYRVCQ